MVSYQESENMSWVLSCHETALSQKIPLFGAGWVLQQHLCQPQL